MNELKGKVAVITGGASVIGLATVEAFLDKGCKVVLSDCDVESGEKQADRLKDKGEVIFIKADVSKEDEVKSMIKQTADKFGSVDVISNNAAIGAQGETHDLLMKTILKLSRSIKMVFSSVASMLLEKCVKMVGVLS
nr:SDR family NAD(P)-dependent oxidoreductase [Alkalibacterium sp. 20]